MQFNVPKDTWKVLVEGLESTQPAYQVATLQALKTLAPDHPWEAYKNLLSWGLVYTTQEVGDQITVTTSDHVISWKELSRQYWEYKGEITIPTFEGDITYSVAEILESVDPSAYEDDMLHFAAERFPRCFVWRNKTLHQV